MSVILNEGALHRLLDDEAGAVGRMLERTANQIAGNAEAFRDIIFENQPGSIKPRIDYEVTQGDLGLQAEVGIIPEASGRVADYLADKWAYVEPDRAIGALMSAWDSQI